MKFKILLKIAILVLICSSLGYSKPRTGGNNGNPFQFAQSPNTVVLQRIRLNANNVDAFFQNTGIFDQNTTSGNLAGLIWPKGSGKTASFTAGLSIGCFIGTANGPKMAQVMASYRGEYAPSAVKYVAGVPTLDNDTKFKMYTVKAGDNANNNPDYANWGLMIPYGAPYEDFNKNGQWDDGIDIPGQINSGQTIFEVLSDAMVSERNPGEGFGGGVNSPILFAEVHFTAWSYTLPGLEDLQFINWVVINKGDSSWRRTYMGVVVDPDLGDAGDDYIGCDTSQNLGYCYNGDDNDPMYGAAPPAFGMDYFKSPYDKINARYLGLTSYVFFTNNGSNPPPCESDPNGEPYPAYLMLTGVKKDSSIFMDPTQTPFKKTRFCYPGDPESTSGWTEKKGSLQNCGRDSTGTPLATNPTGDRRFIFNSGGENFVVSPGDTQNIILAQMVARGSSNVNSVTKLKRLSNTAQIIYDNNFNVTPPPPAPVVNYAFEPTANGRCNIVLNWGDISEPYVYWDSIFFTPQDSNIYKFQGYEVYEINKFANSLPDFTKPETIDPTMIRLVDIFDKNDNIGVVIDTFATYENTYAPFPILPPYKMSAPAGFPNKGISRSITLTSTQFGTNYSGETKFIYGQEYQFAVVAYAVSTFDSVRRGFKLIRNSVGSSITKIRPIAPPAGTLYTMKNGDTLNLNFPVRDLGLCPIIRNQDLLKNATYRVEFSLDSTYKIMRKNNGASNYDTLKTGLKWVNYKQSVDDSSRTYDGVFFNVSRLRSTPTFDGNVGVVRDPTLPSDSIQTRRYGWEYSPAQNRFVEGSKKTLINNAIAKFQSNSMSLTYPTNWVFNNKESKLKPDQLRAVKIKFTGYGNGQDAYRFLGNTGDSIADPSFAPYVVRRKAQNNWFIYQDKREVPFKVYEIDPNDSTSTERQLNCAFVEINRPKPFGLIDGKFSPTADSSGSNEYLYIFNSSYSDNANWDLVYKDTLKTLGLFLSNVYDVMYVWCPKLINSSSNFTVGDEFTIYPYAAQRPYYYNGSTNPFFYEFNTVSPLYGDPTVAKDKNAMNLINVVPNPYYGFSTLDRGSVDKFVTFTNLPLECTIKIYTLSGDLIKTITKAKGSTLNNSSTAEWNLQNQDRVPVASGIYVALIDAPGIGQKVLKIVVFTAQERLNF